MLGEAKPIFEKGTLKKQVGALTVPLAVIMQEPLNQMDLGVLV
jgi:hypothetical protein